LGAALAVVQVVLWVTLEQSSPFLYRGGFALYAAMTCVVITAASLPVGAVPAGLSIPPLLWLGQRSYGIYLVHWPIFLAFRQTWSGAPMWLLAVVGIATSLVLAELSYRYIEQPIRQRRSPVSRHFFRFVALAVLVVALFAALLPTDSADPEGRLDFEQAALDQQALLEQQADKLAAVPSTTAAPMQVPTPTLATFGDSTALLLGLGMLQYAAESGSIHGQEGDVALGCGVSRFERRRVDEVFGFTDECRAWPERWQQVIDRDTPNIAQLVTGSWEVTDVELPGADGFSAIGDPVVDAFIKSELTTAVDILGSRGAMVLLVLWPQISAFVSDGASPGIRAKSDPARWARLRELMREVAAERPDSVRVVDLQSMLADRLEDQGLRPDGIHIPADQANLLYQGELGAETLRLWEQFWREKTAQLTSPPTTSPQG
ncbi:MAG: acyltransferase family protein, partial [Microthrixaceae bacterium]